MSLRAMKRVDHWLGIPACLLLGGLAQLKRKLLRRPVAAPDLRRPVAVFKFFGIGSILQATPLLRALRYRQANARVVLVTFEANAALARLLDAPTDVRIIRTSSPFRFVRDVLSTVSWLRRNRIGVVIDLEFFSKFSTLLSLLSGAPVRAAFHLNDYWRSTALTHPINYNYFSHISQLYAQAAHRFGLSIDDFRLSRIDPPPSAKTETEQFLANRGLATSDSLIGVNINAGDLSLERRWPPDRFLDLIHALLERHPDRHVILTGAPSESAYVMALHVQVSERLRSRVYIATGVLSLAGFVALLDRLRLFITNDSGPMHLASAQGTPIVSLWGPQRPEFYQPAGSRHQAITMRYPCSPCLHMFTSFEGMWCNHEGWCMTAIDVRPVLEAAERMLNLPFPVSENPAASGKK